MRALGSGKSPLNGRLEGTASGYRLKVESNSAQMDINRDVLTTCSPISRMKVSKSTVTSPLMISRKLLSTLQITLVVLCPIIDLGDCCGGCVEHCKQVSVGSEHDAGPCERHAAAEHDDECKHDGTESPCSHNCPQSENDRDCICKGAISTESGARIEADSSKQVCGYLLPDLDSASAIFLNARDVNVNQSASAFATLSGWEIRALIGSLII